MYTLPTEITIKDSILHIRERGDFRIILDCFSALQDTELTKEYRIITALFIFYEDFTDIEEVCNYPDLELAVQEMFKFFMCGEPSPTKESELQLVDWEKDSQLVSAAINKVAGKEVRAENYLHWWTFMGYYNTIGQGTFSMIVTIRKKLAEGEKLEKHEREVYRESPQYFSGDYRSATKRAEEEELRKLWNHA